MQRSEKTGSGTPSTDSHLASPVKHTSHIVRPLITRHAGDAAFYWQQRDGSVHSPLVGLTHLLEFDRLLDAHMDGLRVAGDAGWDIALAQLERWTSGPEVFVCATLALEQADPSARLAAIWTVIQKNPQRMLRGLIAAVAATPSPLANVWCLQWLRPGMPTALAVVAWRARALHGLPLEAEFVQALPAALTSPEPAIRAAACRVAALSQAQSLPPLLQDPDWQIRAEAALGLVGGWASGSKQALTEPQQTQAAGVLWQACQDLGQELTGLGGWYKAQAQHRLARWVCHLGLVVPSGHPAVEQLLKLLPARLGLWLALHHGDGNYLPWIVEQMVDPAVSRFAGWVWSALTGVDLHSQGLSLPPRAASQAPRPTDTHDPGLPEPDVQRIASMGLSLPSGCVSLGGQPVGEALLNAVLWQAPQALRWIAARRLALLGRPAFNTRMRARDQQTLLWPLQLEARAHETATV